MESSHADQVLGKVVRKKTHHRSRYLVSERCSGETRLHTLSMCILSYMKSKESWVPAIVWIWNVSEGSCVEGLGGGVIFKKQGLVGRSWVTGGVPSKRIWGPQSLLFLSLCFLPTTRWAVSSTICSHHNVLSHHRPKSNGANWPWSSKNCELK